MLQSKKIWAVSLLDVNNAFLHESYEEEVFVKFPYGLILTSINQVCLIKKSLYGLKKAFRQWYSRRAGALTYKGYTTSWKDYSLFYKPQGILFLSQLNMSMTSCWQGTILLRLQLLNRS